MGNWTHLTSIKTRLNSEHGIGGTGAVTCRLYFVLMATLSPTVGWGGRDDLPNLLCVNRDLVADSGAAVWTPHCGIVMCSDKEMRGWVESEVRLQSVTW
jgi:hypothetical protein